MFLRPAFAIWLPDSSVSDIGTFCMFSFQPRAVTMISCNTCGPVPSCVGCAWPWSAKPRAQSTHGRSPAAHSFEFARFILCLPPKYSHSVSVSALYLSVLGTIALAKAKLGQERSSPASDTCTKGQWRWHMLPLQAGAVETCLLQSEANPALNPH